MTTLFGKHIITLLKEHECVVLPNIGALLLQDVPAHISAGQIFPSSKKIVFNSKIVSDDNLIIAELVNQEAKTFLSAKLELEKFINLLRFELSQKSYFDLEQVGRFSLVNNEVNFVSNVVINQLSVQNFGFESLSIYAVQREIISKSEKVEQVIGVGKTTTETTERKTKRSIRKASLVGLAASFILLFGVLTLMLSNTNFEQLKVQNAGVLNFLVPSKSVETEAGAIKRIAKNIESERALAVRKEFDNESIDLVTEEKTVEEENSFKIVASKPTNNRKPSAISMEKIYKNVLKVSSENPSGYYVIIGAYSDLANANKAKDKCSKQNTCNVFKTENGMYRVGIYTTTEKTSALNVLKEFKNTNSDYWLMESI